MILLEWVWVAAGAGGQCPILKQFKDVKAPRLALGSAWDESYMQLFLFSLNWFFRASGDQCLQFSHVTVIWTRDMGKKDVQAVVVLQWSSAGGKESWVALPE